MQNHQRKGSSSMDYEDIDVTMVDSRDSFGVIEMNSPKNLPNATPNSDRFSKRPQAKRESNAGVDFKPTQSKFARKTQKDVDQSELDKVYEKRNESKKTAEPLTMDYRYKPAVTFQEKLSVLEDRDRHLREIAYRGNTKNMNTVAEGTCPDMCPEKERLLREVHCSFSIFEGQIVQNEMHVVPELLVKEYARSSADQEEPLPHELRPEPVLIDTMSYLLANVIPKIEEPNIDVAEWYNFCWDRLRSLRKDIIQQQLCSTKVVELLEQSARFHICCFDRLFDRERRIFDDKINAENLVNCLQMLITMYEDLEACGQRCENECEFRLYMMLLLLDSGDLPGIPKWHDDATRRRVEEVKEIYFAFKLNLYTKFFKLVKNTHYLNACILQRYFTTIRVHTLNTLVNAYSPSSQTAKFPVAFAKKTLEMDNDDDMISFVGNYGFTMNYQTNEIHASKSSFSLPETKLACKPSYIIESKRVPILEAVTQTKNYRVDRKLGKVHSSFGENDVLREEAWNAEDQRAKIIDMYGDIYETMEHSPSFISLHETVDVDYELQSESEESFVDVSDSHVAISKVEEPQVAMPPPTNVFNFGAILHERETVDVVDTDCRSSGQQPSTPTPSSPNVLVARSSVRTSQDIEKSPTETTKSYSFKPQQSAVVSEATLEPSSVRDEPIANVRKADEILSSLTNALSQFEQVYWNHFGVSENDRIEMQRLQTLKENRKLRRVVKNRLKCISARKAVRVWKRKVENRRKKEENFVGITHLPPHEYFRLWGTVRKRDNSSLVEEILESQSAAKWSRSLLNAKAYNIKYVGRKLADHLINALRYRYARASLVKGQLPLVICWKLVLAMPNSDNLVSRSFVTKLGEFCRALYYQDEESELGSVQAICSSFKRVLTSVHVKSACDTVASQYTMGTTHLMIFVNELWESTDQSLKRILNSCNKLSHGAYVSLVIIGEYSCKTVIPDLMSALQREKVINGWSVTKWRNFLTVPNAVLKACPHLPVFPSYRVKNLESFVETVGNEFFANLYYIWGCRSENSPIVFIDLCNKFLKKLKEAIEEENMFKYNLSPEFLPYIVSNENAQMPQNNLISKEVSSLITKYSLISFTKWPPSSVEKMIKLLTKYCTQIEDENFGTLLPNVLRLVNVDDNESVERISSKAPWLKIVELWFRYNVCTVSKKEDAKRVFIFYEEEKVVSVANGLWIETLVAE